MNFFLIPTWPDCPVTPVCPTDGGRDVPAQGGQSPPLVSHPRPTAPSSDPVLSSNHSRYFHCHCLQLRRSTDCRSRNGPFSCGDCREKLRMVGEDNHCQDSHDHAGRDVALDPPVGDRRWWPEVNHWSHENWGNCSWDRTETYLLARPRSRMIWSIVDWVDYWDCSADGGGMILRVGWSAIRRHRDLRDPSAPRCHARAATARGQSCSCPNAPVLELACKMLSGITCYSKCKATHLVCECSSLGS